MRPRQTIPRQWLIVSGGCDLAIAKHLGPDTGLLLLRTCPDKDARRLRNFAGTRGLAIMAEARNGFVRVHNSRELRAALLRRTSLVLLSPLHPTTTHPNWAPLPRMRAATLVRLAGRKLVALGGMDARRFARIEKLGFQAWAGISAFRT